MKKLLSLEERKNLFLQFLKSQNFQLQEETFDELTFVWNLAAFLSSPVDFDLLVKNQEKYFFQIESISEREGGCLVRFSSYILPDHEMWREAFEKKNLLKAGVEKSSQSKTERQGKCLESDRLQYFFDF